MRRTAACGLALLLAACGQSDKQDAADAVDAAASPIATDAVWPEASEAPVRQYATAQPTEAELAVLESRDCGAVVTGFAGAVERQAFTFADLFWMPDAEGKSAFDNIVQPMVTAVLTFGEVTQEGAAGSLFCTVEISIADSTTPEEKPLLGTLTLRRVNDVDGATPEQLRWTIRSARFDFPARPS